jgi:anti-anti-sigma factor
MPVNRPSSSCAQFGIEFDYDIGRTLLTLHGELDALSVPAFAGVLSALVERGVRSVAIDLSDLRFCNVGGLRALAELAARLNEVDGRVEILAPAVLTSMLGIADLRSLFVIDDRRTAGSIDRDLDPSRARGSRAAHRGEPWWVHTQSDPYGRIADGRRSNAGTL